MSETGRLPEGDDGEVRLVMVERFLEPIRVQMAKGALESAGIECFVQGENANAMLAFAFRARLMVRAEDEAAAREVLSGVSEGMAPAEWTERGE
ncbi:MAG: hypothetical protein NVSMB3_02620 [Acidobacteriaceae bacterium]